MQLAWDIETDGLLDEVTKIHCINVIDVDTGREYRFTNYAAYQDDGAPTPRDGTIIEGIRFLLSAIEWWFHNGIDYDWQVLCKLYPYECERCISRFHDTVVYSRLIWTNMKDKDFTLLRKHKLPLEFQKKGYIGSHALAAWGYRLNLLKDEFDPADTGHTWANVPFTRRMDDYCMQDVRVTIELRKLILSKAYSAQAMELEIEVAKIISRQQRKGFLFDVDAARALTAKLYIRQSELERECRAVFKPWFAADGKPLTPKRDNKARGYVAGAQLTKVKLIEFNPGSRDHIADRLIKLYSWSPSEFTQDGKPKVDEAILSGLTYPEAKLLTEYLLVSKRLGQVSEGKEAWLKAVSTDGRIHGRVNTNGAVTGRMTHHHPNIAQVPRVTSPYGKDCRALFIVPPGTKLVGCDAEGLELRMLAHYMARYDSGAYVETVVNGKKDNKTDVHSVNQRVMQLNLRDNAKTAMYALLYGAGDHKLGTIVYDDFTEAQRDKFNLKYQGDERDSAFVRLGKRLRTRMMEGLPAFGKLVEAVKAVAKERGYLTGLDGRLLHVRAEHSALNTLLQAAGAIVMKVSLWFMDDRLQVGNFLRPGQDYEWVANIHDEVQAEVVDEHAETVGALAADSIRRAGEHFKLRCPLAGSFDIGTNWASTH